MGFIGRRDKGRRNGGVLTQVGFFGDGLQRRRDKGRWSGREGALCLSWGEVRLRWYSGYSWACKPTGRGQARGPRIRLTPPLVPTHMPIVCDDGTSIGLQPPHA